MRRICFSMILVASALFVVVSCKNIPTSTIPPTTPTVTINLSTNPPNISVPNPVSTPNQTSAVSKYPQFTLELGGYGYQMGDIVSMDLEKEIEAGDIVQYHWILNKSNAGAMGSNMHLAKIIGKPGDKVSFGIYSYTVNNLLGSFDSTRNRWPDWPNPAMWGDNKYEEITRLDLEVPAGEYLADKWIGYEYVPGEFVTGTGSSKLYNRFTIKRSAIKGVVVEKVGHDYEYENQQIKITY